jgi:RHS repeat-associated protein/uncharacterized repeat protein (TIGR01451 family)
VAGSLTARYDHGFGLLSRSDAAGNPAYYAFDAIGNAQQLVTAVGAIADSYAYAPFGAPLRKTETVPNRFQYAGELGASTEPSGLISMRARNYAAVAGRFNSPDPIGLSSGSPNAYVYGWNDAIRFADPSGFCADDMVLPPSYELEYIQSGAWENMSRREWYRRTAKYHLKAQNDFLRETAKAFLLSLYEAWGIIHPPKSITGLLRSVGEDHFVHKILAPKPVQTTYPRDVLESPGPGRYCPWTKQPVDAPIPQTQPSDSGTTQITRPRDPNQMTGPAGFGVSGFISANALLPYRIDFENEPTSTAPAQQAVITDLFSTNLDWATFQLTEIGFGDHLIVLAPNTVHFETNAAISTGAGALEVEIEVGVDLATGELRATFRSLDPLTRLPPPAGVGFLPQENGTGRGQGHISYVIRPKAGLATGTEIRNVALISFDNLPAIATDLVDPHDPASGHDPAKQCLNTIDAGAPTSAVAPLPAQTAQFEFAVFWTGQDDPGGSGVATFDVYVSDNNGPSALWQNAVTNQSALFTGQFGHSYAFYSAARDQVANQESPPATPDATTMVIATAELRVSITYSTPYLMVGDPWSYTITVTNSGSVGATGVFLTNTVPAGLTLVSVLWDSGVCSRTGNVLSWQIGDLAVGGHSALTVTATAGTEGSFTNALVFGGSPPLATVVQNPVITVTPRRPVLAITFSSGTLMLQWPVSPTGYVLESTAALGPQTSWTPVTATPWTVGDTKLLILQPSGAAQFYRLKNP